MKSRRWPRTRERTHSMHYRTDLADFVLDQLDFIQGKLREARDDPASQKGAIIEAGGAISQVRERLWAQERPELLSVCLHSLRSLTGTPRLGGRSWPRWNANNFCRKLTVCLMPSRRLDQCFRVKTRAALPAARILAGGPAPCRRPSNCALTSKSKC